MLTFSKTQLFLPLTVKLVKKREVKNNMCSSVIHHCLNKAEQISVFFCVMQCGFCGWEIIWYQASCTRAVCRLNMSHVCFHCCSTPVLFIKVYISWHTIFHIHYFMVQHFWNRPWNESFSKTNIWAACILKMQDGLLNTSFFKITLLIWVKLCLDCSVKQIGTITFQECHQC